MNYTTEQLNEALMIIKLYERDGAVPRESYEPMLHRIMDYARGLKEVKEPFQKLYEHYYTGNK